jgi:hypothetical protein
MAAKDAKEVFINESKGIKGSPPSCILFMTDLN